MASVIAAAVVLAVIAVPVQATSAGWDQPVTGLTAQPGAGAGELVVSWDAHPAGAADYRLAWAPAGQDFRTWTNTAWNAFPSAAAFTITGLQAGESYRVKVRARNGSDRSPWSTVVTGTAGQQATSGNWDQAVSGLTVQQGVGAGELVVSWDAHPAGAADYRLAWAPAGQDFRSWTDNAWNAFPSAAAFTITGLEAGEWYRVKVRARDGSDRSPWSTVVTGTAGTGETDPKRDKESPPIATRSHVANRAFELDVSDSASCGASACTNTKTYSVSLTGGEEYVAEVWGRSHVQGGDATVLGIVAVESPNGTKLRSDLSGIGMTLREPKVTFTASSLSGTHKVKVRIDSDSHETSTFRVVVYEHVPYTDCGDDIDTTCTVTVGTAKSGEFEIDSLSRSDVDWFRVTLTGGQLYKIVLSGDSTSHHAVGDPFLRGVYDDEGRLLHTDGTLHPTPYFGATQGTADKNSGPGAAAMTYFTPNSTGTYYIGATSAGGARSRAGHYVLTVRTFATDALADDDCHPGMNAAAFSAYAETLFRQLYGQRLGIPPTQSDYDDASARTDGDDTTCEIQVGGTATGRIEHNGLLANRYSGSVKVPGDRDWFKVDLTGGTRYRIEVRTHNNGMRNPGLGGIYNSSGNRVRNGNDSERIDFEPTSSGTYYIEVAGPATTGPNNTGRYRLTVTERP